MKTPPVVIAAAALLAFPALAQEKYQRPPKEIAEILEAKKTPYPLLSPGGDHALLATQSWYPPISDLAEPMLRLAGVRINPKTNGPFLTSYTVALSLKTLPDGAETPIVLPAGARITTVRWNIPGTLAAFANTTANSVDLWILDVASGRAHRVPGVKLNGVLGSPMQWMPDQKTLLVKLVPEHHTVPPETPPVPEGPRVEESTGAGAASSTYEARDLLKTPHDADLFEHYATAQLALVGAMSGTISRIGPAGVIAGLERSPDGARLLVERITRPYSFTRPYGRFPSELEVWDRSGKKTEALASLPLADQVPINGVRTGPRSATWLPTEPSTLVWFEAEDGGDTYKLVPHHDRIVMKRPGGDAKTLIETEQRATGVAWLEGGGVLVSDEDLDKHRTKTVLLDPEKPGTPRVVFDRSTDDHYGDPGQPVYRALSNGEYVVQVVDGAIFLSGGGASPAGNRPFLDRLDLATLATTRLFRAEPNTLEPFLEWREPGKTFLTQRQSPTDVPNLQLRTLGEKAAGAVSAGEPAFTSSVRALTHFADPTPQLRAITKQLVTYKRADGLPLSFTLYLPPGYTPGTKLPTVVWAYPLDYTDPSGAGQVESAATGEFTSLYGPSPVFFALEGYAVLDQVAMPVVGPTETVYDTFIEQVVANAKAAIDKAVELGVTDPDRVGVMGHSHGALMTATLLAWSDLFRAGISRSGAYNHTLRPFGFQNERRTLYRAPETYLKLSPLIHADKIDEPLLIIHGERDVNPGTVPLQSEKLYEALRGVGGTTRLVVLPLESHGYSALESVEHCEAEQIAWFDKYVKNAKPRAAL